MRYLTKVTYFFDSLRVRYKRAEKFGLEQTCGLIRKATRGSLRASQNPSRPGRPPHVRTARGGLKEINFDVRGSQGIIGPRKLRSSSFFNRPVPNIHEKGGTAVLSTIRKRIIARYPERSFMWSTTVRLQREGKIASKFAISLRSTL